MHHLTVSKFIPVKSSKNLGPFLTVVCEPKRGQDSDGFVDETRDLRVSVELFVEHEQGRFHRGEAR